MKQFADFHAELLGHIKRNLELLARFSKPRNTTILEKFQKYISQASVEPYSIKRRHEFLQEAFQHFTTPATKGEIIGNGHPRATQ